MCRRSYTSLLYHSVSSLLIVHAQSIGYLRYDTVMMYKNGGTCELVLMNKTKDSLGVLTNIGNGRTQFVRTKKINDSSFIVGKDTIKLAGPNSGHFIINDTTTTQNGGFKL